jgi:putative transcriptional regulator
MPKLEINPTLLTAALDHSRSNPRGGYKIADRTHEKKKWSSRIKHLRTTLNCTQKEFADRYGVELRTLQNWEQGGRLPDNSSKALMALIENDPDKVRETLAAAKKRAPEMAD